MNPNSQTKLSGSEQSPCDPWPHATPQTVRGDGDTLRPQSYVFMQGKYFAGRILGRLGKNIVTTTTEETLRFDLTTERYFLIVLAYDLHEKDLPRKMRRPVWTLHVNVRSPGNNFETALSKMSQSSAGYFGRTTEEVKTVVPRIREGKVIIPPFTIMGEVD